MAYLPEDYNKTTAPQQGQAAAGQSSGQPIQLSSGQTASSDQSVQLSQQNQKAPDQTQQQTKTEGPKGSGMGDASKNLRQYTEQNKNVQLGQKIGQNLQGKATQVQQGIQQSGQKFQQQIAPEQQRLAAAPGIVNTALNPAKSQYFAGTQQLNPEHIELDKAKQLAGAQAAYQPQLAKLDQAKQDEWKQKYQSYFQPQTQDLGLDTQFGLTQQPQTLGTEQQPPAAPAVNEQLQKDYQNWRLQELQKTTPDQYTAYQKAIDPEGLKSGEQKYYEQNFGKFGALNPMSRWETTKTQYSPETIQANAQAQAAQAHQDNLKQQLQQRGYDPQSAQNIINQGNQTGNLKNFLGNNYGVRDDFNEQAYAQQVAAPQLASMEADKQAAQQSILDEFSLNRFDQNDYQNALRAHLGINDLTADNAELEAQNMLAAQYGLQAYDPAAYEKSLEEQQLAARMADVGQVQATPEQLAAGQGSSPAERLAYFQKLREGAVQQFGVQDASSIQNKVQALQNAADLGKTEAGRYQLLQQTFNRPEYTTGQQRLDQLLLQQRPEQQAQLQNIQQTLAKPAQKQYQDLMSKAGQENVNLAQTAKGVKTDIWKRLIGNEQPTVDASGQLVSGQTGLIPDLEKQIASKVTAAGKTATEETNKLREKIKAGADITAADLKKFLPAGTKDEDVSKVLDYYNESRPESLQDKIINKKSLNDADLDVLSKLFTDQTFTRDQLRRAWDKNANGFADKLVKQFAQNKMAGSETRSGDWKMDFGQYVTDPDLAQYTAANIANPEEYARYAALEALAGQNPNLIKPTEVGQAGTGMDKYGRFNIQQALAKGNEVFNPATYGNLQHVAVPGMPKGSTTLSDITTYFIPYVGPVMAASQLLSKSVGIDIPVVSSISEGVSGTIANLGRDIGSVFGGGGRVICTELYEQGRLSREVWEYEVNYGKYLRAVDPYVIPGYHFWAIPLVRWMRVSPTVTKIVDFCAKPWTNIQIREGTLFGKIYMKIAISGCRMLGRLVFGFKSLKKQGMES